MSAKYYCVSCGSTFVKILKVLKKGMKRPNGDSMELLKCGDCKCEWSE